MSDRTFIKITNRDIYDKIEKLEEMFVDHNRGLQAVRQQVKWHQRIAMVIIPAGASVLWYLVLLVR